MTGSVPRSDRTAGSGVKRLPIFSNIRERLGGGRSPRSRPADFTRQRVAQIETMARRKLGLTGSLEEVIHSDDRADRALMYLERGRRVRLVEMRHDLDQVRPVRQRRPERWEIEHEALVSAFLAECA